MRPHAQNANGALLLENLVDKAMLNVDAPRIRTVKIADRLLVKRRILERSHRQDFKQRLRLGLQPGCRELLFRR